MSPLGYWSPSITLYVLGDSEDRVGKYICIVLRVASSASGGIDYGVYSYLVYVLNDEDLRVDRDCEGIVGSEDVAYEVASTRVPVPEVRRSGEEG